MLPLGFASVGISLLSWFGVERFALWGDQFQTQKEVITPELSSFISHIVEENKIPGLTLGIVHSNGTVEQAAWGIKSEEGEATAVDVSLTYTPPAQPTITYIHDSEHRPCSPSRHAQRHSYPPQSVSSWTTLLAAKMSQHYLPA